MTASNIHYDFLIVGNGAIGTYSALALKQKFINKKVGIIGNLQRQGSASVAAGAMAAVYGEVEACCESHKELEAKYLSVGVRARPLWKDFLNKTSSQDVITSKSTIVFLKKDYSEYEEKNFEACAKAAIRDNAGTMLSQLETNKLFPHTNKKIDRAVKLHDEFSMCTTLLFKRLDLFCENEKIDRIGQNVIEIDSKTMTVKTKGNTYTASKIIVAAGAQTTEIIKDEGIIPMLQGVGTALLIKTGDPKLKFLTENVFRSVNRGGSNCGLHCLPRSDGSLYVGAGNYVSNPGESGHRFESIRYLLAAFGSELTDDEMAYKVVGDLHLGYRPISLDRKPMIGCLKSNKNIFIATGANRVGLTWTPDISDQIVKWAVDKDISSEYLGWNPCRVANSLMTEAESLKFFCSSRYAAAVEHSLFNVDDQSSVDSRHLEIETAGKNLIQKLKNKTIWTPEAVHPDNWGEITSEVFETL